MVRFRFYIDQYEIDRADNYVEGREGAEWINRRLRRIERYMKKHNLLFPHEFLEFIEVPHNHIRIPYIETISREKNWIEKNEYLKIVC